MPLYVEETGTPGAASLIFLHGVGASGWMWWQQIAALTDFHCLNIDLPGHGKSQEIAWVSLTETAHQLATIIQARATHGQAHLVGLSLGGYVALALLADYPHLVQRAILSGVTVAPMPNRSLLKPQLGLMSIMRRRWVATMQAKLLRLPAPMQAVFTENLQAMSLATYRRILEEVMVFALPSALQQVDNPTLVTAGSNESKIILQAVDEIPKIMPQAQGYLAPGLGHGWNVQAPDLFNDMVRAWITSTLLPARLTAVANLAR